MVRTDQGTCDTEAVAFGTPTHASGFVPIRLALVLCLAASGPALAQSPPPVIFVHGISSSDLTWTATAVALRDDGYGEPVSVHVDLNASDDTDVTSDVVRSGFVPFTAFTDSGRVAVREGAPEAVASRQFFVNFRAYATDDDSLTVHRDRDRDGRSNSNESGIVKQGAALGLVVADVLAATGAPDVILVGHSMGGLAIREYLQRTDADGRPAWWVDPEAEGGHRVRAAVTYGTPHLGSNLNDLGTGVGAGIVADPRSEAVRDLRFTYPGTALGPGRYLYGGVEIETDAFYSFDVTADGDEDDTVIGLNDGDPEEEYAVDNPAMPLPRDVDYTWIVGDVRGLGGDGVVDEDRQWLRRRTASGVDVPVPEGIVRIVVTSRSHVQQTSDVGTIRSALAVATPTERVPEAVALALHAFPNPTASGTTIEAVLLAPAHVRLRVVDALGREVAVLVDGPQSAGPVLAQWDASGLAPGVYAVVLDVDGARHPRPVTVVR